MVGRMVHRGTLTGSATERIRDITDIHHFTVKTRDNVVLPHGPDAVTRTAGTGWRAGPTNWNGHGGNVGRKPRVSAHFDFCLELTCRQVGELNHSQRYLLALVP
jgi:hypothetical protein